MPARLRTARDGGLLRYNHRRLGLAERAGNDAEAQKLREAIRALESRMGLVAAEKATGPDPG